ncbi:transcription-repair coupling factor [[Clostridium] scindens]|uniref:transcription-repair coupling factor n=2 Tax=Clostridium scindens (strain JCM 10418 / VPI 12708) TaxID=29347 RepID=UPI001D08CCE7|nr:transcription-repair coupling factor [[Clostridium] scindens]MCB6285404.1 transcription-repair coupling factor [[Clostridium] scindens]MCB6420101.1 transcription-repair coupling factor [[Clostridium] scindens]MCB7191802.1 transcription-repair coupling factor [[Clostridium] scindens]MCB7284985.1 transcription-repair coupling factor [[Clostridium] scindens]MCG4928826.1 transcription-repair coupling factor [[Clostridium] scindens]
MQALIRPVNELAEFEEISRDIRKGAGMIRVCGCVNSQKTHMMYALSDGCNYRVIACSSESKAKQVYEEYRFLDPNTYLYPAKDLLFYQADLRSKELVSQRMEVIQAVAAGEEATVVTSFDAFMDSLLPKDVIVEKTVRIANDSTLHLEEMQSRLVALGYDREVQIEAPGQFAVRGGILDVYPLTEELPIRIELWGDEVDSIRTFDVETQRSIENLEEVSICPAVEFPQEGEKGVSFLDYFPKEETILFLDEPVRLIEKGQGVEEEFLEAQKKRVESGYEVTDAEVQLYHTEEILKKMNAYSSVGFFALDMKCRGLETKASFSLQTKSVNPYNSSFDMLTQDLKRLKRNGYRVVLLSGSRTRAKRLAEDLRDYNLSSYYSDELDREVAPGEIMTAYGHVAYGYEYPMLKFTVISETDIFGKTKKKKKRKTYEGRKIQSFAELKVGDYVVHENHGLGIYQGIEKIEVDKISKDYMKISYAQGGNLYIPATQLDLIQKYASADAKKPKLNRLGTQEWTKTKTRVRGAVREIAKDLVRLYAARQEQEGYVYGEDTVWQREFEEMFPFEETEDQLLAIEAVKRDMMSHKIMDRLICGDVGYGKTEIAIRAAFKAVQEDKQVVYLVPTTILAQQHYNTFAQRMKDFPVRVDLMCRFRTPAQQKKTIEDTKKGLVDIVIGTHRVLSDDLKFKDLGLLIIDEEQRFGVQHKEKIKKLKENVDVLTLTATPIPRTLHMSLIGIRDMSVLEEAPNDRMPIQTYVMEYNDEMVREAIERECGRQGQVYYVYNRVEDIAEITGHIQKLVPDVTVEYAHGQMKEHQLERIMYDFINGEIDVLVSTTIIETGLDISNVNTMIIHDADHLGLSQLYQLRGRVGRSNRMAYAFLLYRRDKLLREVAEKRLAAIREFTDLGSGFKIAMRDLEIRGAGNLLGAEQHGHMEAVGYDLYCKMLNEAVKHLKGEMEEETFNTTMDLNVDAYIPDSYIPNEYQKLDIYKRVAAIENEEEMEDMLEELIDRFGDIPKKVETLLAVASLKAIAHSAYVTAVEQKGERFTFSMYEKAKVQPQKIPGLLEQFKGDLTFKADAENPCFLYEKKSRNKKEKNTDVLAVVKNVLIGIKGLIDQ